MQTCGSIFWVVLLLYLRYTVCKHSRETILMQMSNEIYYDSVETTNKMQPCNRIYYSTVH